MECKNCGTEFEGNFCNNCGQNADVHRFNFTYFLKETFFSSLDIERGFFSTIKELFLRPGAAIREYLKGKRLSLFVPGKFLLLFGAIATFLSIHYGLYLSEEVSDMYSSRSFLPMLEKFLKFAEEYTTVINIITIPVFALSTYVFFRKWAYNFTEHLILNIYITAVQLIMLIAAAPIIAIFRGAQEEVIFGYGILTVVYNYWVFHSFFKVQSLSGIFRVLLSLIFAYVIQFLFNYAFYLFFSPYLEGLDISL